jgi:hypothetical protein
MDHLTGWMLVPLSLAVSLGLLLRLTSVRYVALASAGAMLGLYSAMAIRDGFACGSFLSLCVLDVYSSPLLAIGVVLMLASPKPLTSGSSGP